MCEHIRITSSLAVSEAEFRDPSDVQDNAGEGYPKVEKRKASHRRNVRDEGYVAQQQRFVMLTHNADNTGE